MRVNRRVRFYNPGLRIQHTYRYTDPGGHDIHCLSLYEMDAPEAGFFDVPEESELSGAIIRHTFDRDIIRDWAGRGVVMIDANYEPNESQDQDDAYPMAKDDKAAIAKGKRKWLQFVHTRVEEHLAQCDQARASGGVPAKASGAMVRYLKIEGIVDPAERAYEEQKRQTATLESLTERLDRLERENKELKAREITIAADKIEEFVGKGKGKTA